MSWWDAKTAATTGEQLIRRKLAGSAAESVPLGECLPRSMYYLSSLRATPEAVKV